MDGNPATLALLHDRDAERAVLAAALLDTERAEGIVGQLSRILDAADFYDPRHGVLWEVFVELNARGEPIDVLTTVAELRRRDRLQTVGGPQYLGELTDQIPTLAHSESHAHIVADLARRRRVVDAYQIGARRVAAGFSVDDARNEVDRSLAQCARPGGENVGYVGADFAALSARYWARREGREVPLPTPWPSVTHLLGEGLWPGMYVLVGGTGAGKTQWAVQTAVESALVGFRVLYLALELSRVDLAARVVGTIASVPWSGILRGRLAADEETRVAEAMRVQEKLPFAVECAVPYGFGAETLAARAAALKPQLIVLDYLQLCAARKGEETRAAVGRVAYVARALARDLGAVVLLLSSTSRANYAELVNDPAKEASDLVGLGKESGEIEYAADGVLVMAKHAERRDTRVLVMAKNRHGPVGRVELEWNGTAFSEALGTDMPEAGGAP